MHRILALTVFLVGALTTGCTPGEGDVSPDSARTVDDAVDDDAVDATDGRTPGGGTADDDLQARGDDDPCDGLAAYVEASTEVLLPLAVAIVDVQTWPEGYDTAELDAWLAAAQWPAPITGGVPDAGQAMADGTVDSFELATDCDDAGVVAQARATLLAQVVAMVDTAFLGNSAPDDRSFTLEERDPAAFGAYADYVAAVS